MKFPEGLFYTESHEWVRDEGSQVTLGLTDYAQSQLKGHFSEFIYQNIGCNLLGKWGRKCS